MCCGNENKRIEISLSNVTRKQKPSKLIVFVERKFFKNHFLNARGAPNPIIHRVASSKANALCPLRTTGVSSLLPILTTTSAGCQIPKSYVFLRTLFCNQIHKGPTPTTTKNPPSPTNKDAEDKQQARKKKRNTLMRPHTRDIVNSCICEYEPEIYLKRHTENNR